MTTTALRWHPPRLPVPDEVVLTPALADVLTGLHYGLTTDQIAGHLHISHEAVRSRVAKLRRALGARDRAHAVALAGQALIVVQVRQRGVA